MFNVDISQPPISPPNRDGWIWPFIGWIETKESKKLTSAWEKYIEAYDEALGNSNNRN